MIGRIEVAQQSIWLFQLVWLKTLVISKRQRLGRWENSKGYKAQSFEKAREGVWCEMETTNRRSGRIWLYQGQRHRRQGITKFCRLFALVIQMAGGRLICSFGGVLLVGNGNNKGRFVCCWSSQVTLTLCLVIIKTHPSSCEKTKRVC